MELDVKEIQKMIPQRYPFLMIDRIVELEPKKRVVAIKNVTVNEPYFVGHFPGEPIMPGVLITEAMAQASIVMMHDENMKNLLYFFAGIDVKFKKPVMPGDQLRIESKILKFIKNAGFAEVEAKVGDDIVAKGQISFAARENKSL